MPSEREIREEPKGSRSVDQDGTSQLKKRMTDWGIPSKQAGDILERHNFLRHPKRAVIFRQGSPGDLLFWVRTGIVELSLRFDDGNRILTRLAGPGDIFGFLSVDDPRGRSSHIFEARAMTSCEVGFVTVDQVAKTMRTLDPMTLIRLSGKLVSCWAEDVQSFVRLLSMNYRMRLRTVFAYLAASFGVKRKKGVLVTLELGHRDLAEMIGSSRPIVSQLIDQMRRAGIIEKSGKRYVVLDPSKL